MKTMKEMAKPMFMNILTAVRFIVEMFKDFNRVTAIATGLIGYSGFP